MDNPFKEENPFASSSDPYSGGADDIGAGAYVPPVSSGASAEQISLDVNPFLDPTQAAGGAPAPAAAAPAPAGRAGDTGAYGSTSQRTSNIFGGGGGAPSASPMSAGGAYGPSDPREQALNQKERELAAKEAELRQREADLAKRFPGENKNWPRCVPAAAPLPPRIGPLPPPPPRRHPPPREALGLTPGPAPLVRDRDRDSCYPIFYHDIDADIPAASQSMVRQVYYTWLGLFACLTYNALCVTLALFSVGAKVITGWLMAIIYFGAHTHARTHPSDAP